MCCIQLHGTGSRLWQLLLTTNLMRDESCIPIQHFLVKNLDGYLNILVELKLSCWILIVAIMNSLALVAFIAIVFEQFLLVASRKPTDNGISSIETCPSMSHNLTNSTDVSQFSQTESDWQRLVTSYKRHDWEFNNFNKKKHESELHLEYQQAFLRRYVFMCVWELQWLLERFALHAQIQKRQHQQQILRRSLRRSNRLMKAISRLRHRRPRSQPLQLLS